MKKVSSTQTIYALVNALRELFMIKKSMSVTYVMWTIVVHVFGPPICVLNVYTHLHLTLKHLHANNVAVDQFMVKLQALLVVIVRQNFPDNAQMF